MAELRGEAWITSPEKRRQDIMMITAAAPVLGALGLAAAVAIKLDQPRLRLLHREPRVSKGNSTFVINKFRTLIPGQPLEPQRAYHIGSATIVGDVLRTLGIDEIPQAFNILRDNMSVVGPRPVLPRDIPRMQANLSETMFEDWQHVIKTCRPGWFNLYGIKTHRPEPITTACYRERARSDIQYFEQASAGFDRQIITEALSLGPCLVSEAVQLNWPALFATGSGQIKDSVYHFGMAPDQRRHA